MPQPLVFDLPDYQTNETFKQFDSTDALGKAYLDLNGRVTAGGIDLLPEEIRKDPAITPFKTLADLSRGYVETKKMVGAIEKAPEKPDGYKLTQMQNLHPGLKADVLQGHIRNIAFKAGLGNKAADVMQQEILTLMSGNMAKMDADKKVNLEKNETALRQKWGAEYDTNMDRIVNIFTKLDPEMMKETEGIKAALKGAPKFLEGMSKLVGFLSEDAIKSLGDDGAHQVTDAASAKTAIEKLETEINTQGQKHPFWDDKHPDHAKTLALREELYKKAYPS